MKRYWIFAWDTYYPSAGLGDVKGVTNDYTEADNIWHQNIKEGKILYDYGCIVDMILFKIVFHNLDPSRLEGFNNDLNLLKND